MNKLGTGYYYDAYDIGDNRVVKKQRPFTLMLRSTKMINVPLVLKQNKTARENTTKIKKMMTADLAPALGHPNFISAYEYEQDKVTLLMDYFDAHSLDENKAAIDQYIDLTLLLLTYGIHDYVYKFKNSYGFNKDNQLVFIDFNEVVFSLEKTLDFVKNKHWEKEAQYSKFPESPLKEHMRIEMESRITPTVVRELFGTKVL